MQSKKAFTDDELGSISAFGKQIKRTVLHQDPFKILGLMKDHNEQLEEMAEKLKSG